MKFEENRHHIHFITKNNPPINMKIGYDNKLDPVFYILNFLI